MSTFFVEMNRIVTILALDKIAASGLFHVYVYCHNFFYLLSYSSQVA